MEVVVLIPIAVILVIAIRLAAGGMDRSRIERYVEERGGKVLDAAWRPFGPGWFGEKSDRIYEVRFRDKDGNEHAANCKTSLWTGVYFTHDEIVKHVAQPEATGSASALEAENQRLREQIERMKEGR